MSVVGVMVLRDGELIEVEGGTAVCHKWCSSSPAFTLGPGTHIGFCGTGLIFLDSTYGAVPVGKDMFFATPGVQEISPKSTSGACMVISFVRFRSTFLMGGPIEPTGRLKYVDGATDSLLIPPVVRGDPCLNHLHFPSGCSQRWHTHPSFRATFISAGEGRLEFSLGNEGQQALRLEAGSAFLLGKDVEHRFVTEEQSLDAITWHPDSDTGPTDDDHPMLNRTYVNAASLRGDIAQER
jgi:quercetin dioxygenase-like cupin family protein